MEVIAGQPAADLGWPVRGTLAVIFTVRVYRDLACVCGRTACIFVVEGSLNELRCRRLGSLPATL